MISPIQNNILNNMTQVAAQGNPGRSANQQFADQLIQNAAAPAKSICQRFADWIREVFQSLFSCCKKSPALPTPTTNPVAPTTNNPTTSIPVNPITAVLPLGPLRLAPADLGGVGIERARHDDDLVLLGVERARGHGYELMLPGDTHLLIFVGDITRQGTDIVVNAANEGGLGGGGVDAALSRAAGNRLAEARRALPEVRPGVRIPVGEARMTVSGDLNITVQYMVHAVAPRWPREIPYNIRNLQDENLTLAQRQNLELAERQLKNAYKYSLDLALQNPLADEDNDEPNRSISFPLIGCHFGWPVHLETQIALDAILEWNAEHPDAMHDIRIVLSNGALYNNVLQTAQETIARRAGEHIGARPLLARDAQLRPLQRRN